MTVGVLDSLENFCKVFSTVQKKSTSLKHSRPIFQKMALLHRFFENRPHRGQIYIELPVQNIGEGKHCTSLQDYSNIQSCSLGVLDSFKNFCKVSSTVRENITPLKHKFPDFSKNGPVPRIFTDFFENRPLIGVKPICNYPSKTVVRESIVRLFSIIPT